MENEVSSSSVFENGSFERFAVLGLQNHITNSLKGLERLGLDGDAQVAGNAPRNNRAKEEQVDKFVTMLLQILNKLYDSCQTPHMRCVLTSNVLQQIFRQDESRRFYAREPFVSAQ